MIKNILIVKYGSVGDIVNAVPAVRHLRESLPEAKIYWLVKEAFAGLVEDADFIDGIVEYRSGGGFPGRAVLELVKNLRRLEIDTVIDFQGLLKSALIGFLSGAKNRFCFPYTREFSSILYTRPMGKQRGACHAVQENLSVVEELTGRKIEGRGDISIDLKPEVLERAAALLKSHIITDSPIVVISPSSRWPSKMWAAEKFSALADLLVTGIDAAVILTGAAGDVGYVESIKNGMRAGAVNLAGRTDLKMLAGVIKLSDLVVSCDSGPMHMACALGVPVAAVFGPTDPSYTGPYGENSIVVRAETRCAPCRKRKCAGMTCMDGVSVGDVYQGALEIFRGAALRVNDKKPGREAAAT